MKIRQSFVANSSSSSFILGVKQEVLDSANAKSFAGTFMKILKRNSTIYETYEEFIQKRICYDYCYDNQADYEENASDYEKEYVNNCKAAFDAGYVVMNLRIDNGEEILPDILNSLPKEPKNDVYLIYSEY